MTPAPNRRPSGAVQRIAGPSTNVSPSQAMTSPAMPVPAAAQAAAMAPAPQANAPASPEAAAVAPPQTNAAPPQPAPAQPAAAVQEPPVAPATAAQDGTTTVPKGFSLPDLGAPPDRNDPKYADKEFGPSLYEVDRREYEHKQNIHRDILSLDTLWTKMFPNRDFQSEYDEAQKMQKEHEASAPKPEGWKRGLLALGDMNPAVKESGLATYDKNRAEEKKSSDTSFSQRMMLKQKLHEEAAAQAEREGNWKMALAEKEKAALSAADNEGLAHARDMEKTREVIAGQNQRAKMRGETMLQSAKLRAESIASHHFGLGGSLHDYFMAQVAKQLATRFGGESLTKTYDPVDLDSITSQFEDLAQRLDDAKNHKDTSEKNAPPAAPKAAGKQKF